MAFWNNKTYTMVRDETGQLFQVEDGLASIPEPKPEPPAPDLATKPADIVGYCFGFACPEGHVENTFETVTVDGYQERKVCQTCGQVSRPATVKRTSESEWVPGFKSDCLGRPYRWDHSNMGWSNSGHYYDVLHRQWTSYEFIRFLETGKKTKK